MKNEFKRSSTSEREFTALIEYFAAIDDELARRFMKAVDDTIDAIADFPELGIPWESPRPRQRNLLWRNVRGFENYLVIYRRVQNGVLILRIVDGRRDLESIL